MEVSKQIIEVLDYLCDKIGIAIDWTAVFANENVVPYIEQICRNFITYEIATSIAYLIIGIVFLFVGRLAIKNAKYCEIKYGETGKRNDWDTAQFFATAIAVLSIVIGICIISTQVFDIIECITFPEKVIFEELKSIYDNME